MSKMQIWVDGDACPFSAKQILFKAAERTQIKLIVVANHLSKIPNSPYLSLIVVATNFDEADNYITAHANPQDLVITADIPLAANVISKGCLALNPRGMLYDKDNIKQQLAVRNLMTDLRSQMLISGGTASYSKSDIQVFAANLDKILTKYKQSIK